MSIRNKISAVYWDAVKKLGPLVPTPQVVGAGLAAIVAGLISRYGVELEVVGISEELVVGAISLGVAYLIGPEPSVPPGTAILVGVTKDPELVEGFDQEPQVPGEFVGEEDDPDAPGTGIV